MKIAIPTNDGINISDHFFKAQTFKVFNVENGKIVSEEIRIHNNTPSTTIDKMFEFISDCDVYIIDNNDSIASNLMRAKEKTVEKTYDSIITNIIVDYKNEQQRIESNTLCCP